MSNKYLTKNLLALGSPFQPGEVLLCGLCSNQELILQDQVALPEGWRAIDGNGIIRVYICPECIPEDQDTEEERDRLYFAFFQSVGRVMLKKAPKVTIKTLRVWRILDGQAVDVQEGEHI